MQPGAPHSHQPPYNVCPAKATVANGVDVPNLALLEGESQIGSTSMNTLASSNLILTAFSSLKGLAELEEYFGHAGLYQGIPHALTRRFRKCQTLADLAATLASVADHAYDIRQFDIVGEVGRLLLSPPDVRQVQG
jgi:hypothetical protein